MAILLQRSKTPAAVSATLSSDPNSAIQLMIKALWTRAVPTAKLKRRRTAGVPDHLKITFHINVLPDWPHSSHTHSCIFSVSSNTQFLWHPWTSF